MLRRLFAALSAAALIVCAGRVASWAASPSAAAHACCQAQKGKTAAPALTDCCPAAAATISPRLAPAAPAAAFSTPVLPRTPSSISRVPEAIQGPPRAPASRTLPPSRAPPLG